MKFCRFFWMVLLIQCATRCRGDEEEKKMNIIANTGIESRLENSNKVVSTQSWQGSLTMFPTVTTWSVKASIPYKNLNPAILDPDEERGQKGGIKKKMKKYMMPLLLAYKLKFFTLIPVMIGGLVLLTGATGLAGFFFALFAAVMGLKSEHHNQ